ncbi:hypothetical protein [Azoarcus sp. KH32C]|uniref:hypothetical protein n=1 Tax=Azoarcus sp. KH32C TaxID=748247 RepID=UPI00023866E1|nr:hypothetical protein [Azoarcus sp. KH32C]BAL23675.1 hypothetical protein AZKH_1353 [Azoarcus sp. KH32C]
MLHTIKNPQVREIAIKLREKYGDTAPTKKEVRAALSATPRTERSYTLDTATDEIYRRLTALAEFGAVPFRAEARLGRAVTDHEMRGLRRTKPLSNELPGRLLEHKCIKPRTTYLNLYRHNDGGHTALQVAFTDDPAKVGVSSERKADWEVYRGKFKGWAYDITTTTITLPRLWRNRVFDRGLHAVDGMMCLDASQLDGAPQGVELFAARWVVQGRGYEVRCEEGFVARQGEVAHHGSTPRSALQGLKRKQAAAEAVALAETALQLPFEQLVRRLGSATEKLFVDVKDARAVGACEFGITSWCHRVGLDYAAGRAPFAQVFEKYLEVPAVEARAAMLYVLRRHRKKLAVAA